MFKNILVPTSGSDTDDSVFATALAVALPLSAHLDFYHSRLTCYEAAARSPHVQFCLGTAMTDALAQLSRQDETRSANAVGHVDAFCRANGVDVRSAPTPIAGVTARLTQETDPTEARLLLNARHSDLVILGRPRHVDLMPANLIETLLLGSGRPIMIASDSPRRTVTGTVVVGWKETPEAARALGAALPLLKLAQRVVLVTVSEEPGARPPELKHLADRLAWHGVAAESCVVTHISKPTSAHLLRVAEELGADLLVVGGYGRGPWREAVFGGVTRALIEHAEFAVFMMH